MGNLAKTIFSILLGWFPTVVYTIWSGLNHPDGNGFFSWIGHHLILIFAVLCVIGVSADTIVYCFRWKPLTVWKSFFHRRKNKDAASVPIDGPEDNPDMVPASAETDMYPVFSANYRNTVPGGSGRRETAFSETTAVRDNPERYANVAGNAAAPERIPQRAPYQRPEPMTAQKTSGDGAVALQSRNEAVPGPRRRRTRMQQLFGEAEEDLLHYEAPKPVINQRDAYHQPVYPRNWKGNRDSTQ